MLRCAIVSLVIVVAWNAAGASEHLVARTTWLVDEARWHVLLRERMVRESEDATIEQETTLQLTNSRGQSLTTRWKDEYRSANRPFLHASVATVSFRGHNYLLVRRPEESAGGPMVELTMYDLHQRELRPVLRSRIDVDYFYSPRCSGLAQVRVTPELDARLSVSYEWPVLPSSSAPCQDAIKKQVVRAYAWKNGCFAEVPGQETSRRVPLPLWERECVPGLGRALK